MKPSITPSSTLILLLCVILYVIPIYLSVSWRARSMSTWLIILELMNLVQLFIMPTYHFIIFALLGENKALTAPIRQFF